MCRCTCPGHNKVAQNVEADAFPICAASPSTEEQADLIACTFDLFGITSVIEILIASLIKSHNIHSFLNVPLFPSAPPPPRETMFCKRKLCF